MKGIELLAPAGSLESLYAAINKGCNAVYMGGSKFSARAYASNFTNEDLEKAVNYAHLYGVKIHIALNTLIKEEEVLEAFEYISFLYSIGVDALIVQDLGMVEILKTYFKDFEIHASTQLTIHNGEGALFFTKNGFQRIVLSRELTLKDIEYIAKDLDIETEIFVHGALCVCYSGQCLMSSLIGGRSGNRGRCAQPCRLPYTLINKDTKEERKGYLLSPKDVCNIENVEDLIESGVDSLKIEGRMKRPEYVAGVVESYRKVIDSYYKKNTLDKEKEKKKLLQLFNREGFSKAYLYGNKGRDMMSYNFPKNTGVYIGEVFKDNTIILEEGISIGDGIRNGEKGFTISKILKNNKEVSEGNKGDRVVINPTNYNKGEKLYKTLDST
ncbi:peptidase U32 family protein, partial [Clostridium sp.]|uniref:peptidase U32 family protein n=1 Tax=Clostridium sp. TaxID=1506 RepID=UPI00346444D0